MGGLRAAVQDLGAAGGVTGFEFQALAEDGPVYGSTERLEGGLLVAVRGESRFFADLRPEAAAEGLEAGDVIKAPMPGKVLAVNVSAGDTVAKGQALVVLEAMKMEHGLAAPRDGVIGEVSVEAGAQVAEGDLLVQLDAE